MTRKVTIRLGTLIFCTILLCACAAPAASPTPSATAPEPTLPSVQGESLSFKAQYYRTDGYDSDVRYPIVTVLRSAQEAQRYHPTGKGIANPAESCRPESYLGKYDEAYFQDHLLIVVQLAEGSGSIRHKVTSVVRAADGAKVLIQRIHPDGAETADMAVWHVLVELSRTDFSDVKAEALVYE